MITIVGVILTINLSPSELQFNHLQMIGVMCALLAGFFYSLATIIAKKTKSMPVPMMTFLQLLIGTLILLPMIKWSGMSLTGQAVMYILALGVIHTILAFILYYHSVSKLSTERIAVISYVDPIVAIATDVAFFDRHLLPIQMVGIVITLIGSYFVINPQAIKKFLPQRFNLKFTSA